jgi:hypothetical protein
MPEAGIIDSPSCGDRKTCLWNGQVCLPLPTKLKSCWKKKNTESDMKVIPPKLHRTQTGVKETQVAM